MVFHIHVVYAFTLAFRGASLIAHDAGDNILCSELSHAPFPKAVVKQTWQSTSRQIRVLQMVFENLQSFQHCLC